MESCAAGVYGARVMRLGVGEKENGRCGYIRYAVLVLVFWRRTEGGAGARGNEMMS